MPAVGCSNPAIIRSIVVLPEPDGPSSAKNSPAAMSSDTSSTAVTVPKRLVTDRTEMAAVCGPALAAPASVCICPPAAAH